VRAAAGGWRQRAAAPLLAALALALVPADGTATPAEPRPVTVAHGLVHPWALAGVPAVDAGGQCGLLDVAVDPRFADNGRVWFTFAEPGDGGNTVALAAGRLGPQGLSDVQVVFRQQPRVRSTLHCGSRIVFDREGRVLLGLGDRFSRKDDAQTLDNHMGKVVRLQPDGRAAAAGNPFAGTPGALPEVFSRGHRNIQGAALHPGTGELWAVEHGPQGGDELNVVEAGRNYGWPLVTYGRNYGIGTRIGEEGPRPGFEQPLRHWVPTSVAPSGMAFVTGERYPGWKGSLLVGTLRAQVLLRLTLDGRKVVAEERLLQGLRERIRDVREGPDGFVYLLTDSADGRVLRLQP
jgi:glucose/arabinose dehydrogenase